MNLQEFRAARTMCNPDASQLDHPGVHMFRSSYPSKPFSTPSENSLPNQIHASSSLVRAARTICNPDASPLDHPGMHMFRGSYPSRALCNPGASPLVHPGVHCQFPQNIPIQPGSSLPKPGPKQIGKIPSPSATCFQYCRLPEHCRPRNTSCPS